MTSLRCCKEREEEFRRHANNENSSLAADWCSITDTWTFRGGSGERSERVFKSLARKAARGINGIPSADAWKAWLDSLRQEEFGFEVRFRHSSAYNQKRRDYVAQSVEAIQVVEGIVETVALLDGSLETRTRVEGITGTIERVFETSADFCLELGSHGPPDATEEVQPGAKAEAQTTVKGEGIHQVGAVTPTVALASQGAPPTAPLKKRLREEHTKAKRRDPKYADIYTALRQIAEARPTSHEEVFRALEGRTRLPHAQPFVSSGGWLAGFKRNKPAARSWLSRAWSGLDLRPFPRGPKQ